MLRNREEVYIDPAEFTWSNLLKYLSENKLRKLIQIGHVQSFYNKLSQGEAKKLTEVIKKLI